METKEDKSGQKYRPIILFFLIGAAIGLYLFIQTQKPSTTTVNPAVATAIGQQAPDFELPLLSGGTARLSDYKGKIVFLNIWATWCRPCQEEMPSMEKLYQKLKDLDFEILAVSIDAQGASAVQPFVKAHKLTFPILLDQQGAVSRLYNTTGVPETFILDKNGALVSKVIGYRDWFTDEVVQTLTTLAQSPAGGN